MTDPEMFNDSPLRKENKNSNQSIPSNSISYDIQNMTIHFIYLKNMHLYRTEDLTLLSYTLNTF